MKPRIYLDHNATTPLAPEVAAAMSPYLADASGNPAYGNPSSQHWAGIAARDAVERARSQVAALLCSKRRPAQPEPGRQIAAHRRASIPRFEPRGLSPRRERLYACKN